MNDKLGSTPIVYEWLYAVGAVKLVYCHIPDGVLIMILKVYPLLVYATE